MNNEDASLKKRYVFKLSTNLMSLIINLFIQAIVPRGLGPKAYGDFNFLTNFFSQLIGFLDMGTSNAFFTKLSQRPKESSLIIFYLYFSVLASAATILFIIATRVLSIQDYLWPNQATFFIFLAALWGILTWFSQVLIKIMDAYGLTVSSEIARIAQKLLSLLLVAAIFFYKKLNLLNYFYYNFVILLFLCLIIVLLIKKSGRFKPDHWGITARQINDYIHEFYDYCAPLVSYALTAMVVGVFDRWILQTYGGSEQQGFFSLSYQIGAVCFLFTNAMTPLLTREFSIAYANKDLSLMAHYFRRYIPLLYSIAVYFSCFVAVQAEVVVRLFGGTQYAGAIVAVSIMAFYPIHQTYGQLSGSVFYATGQTKLYRNIGILLSVIGLPVTYILIAPSGTGFGAGAIGLAIKTVLLQIIAVNIQLYFNAKLLGLSFFKYLGHQFLSLGCMLFIAWGTVSLVNTIYWFSQHIIVGFMISGMFYTFLVLVLAYQFPVIFGLNREDIKLFTSSVRHRLKIRQ